MDVVGQGHVLSAFWSGSARIRLPVAANKPGSPPRGPSLPSLARRSHQGRASG